MTPTIQETRAGAEPDLLRFDGTERAVHWVTAILFFVLMGTGAALYAGPISTVVGHREVVRNIHVYSGIALPVPIVIGLVLRRRGHALRADISRLNRWNTDDKLWLRRSTRAQAQLGKFNSGQKLNAVFLAAAGVLMLGTGIILKWFSLFSLSTRTGATFVHDWVALAIWLAVGAHILFALRDPVALSGMMRGRVTARWARKLRPRWYEEQTGRAANRLKQPG